MKTAMVKNRDWRANALNQVRSNHVRISRYHLNVLKHKGYLKSHEEKKPGRGRAKIVFDLAAKGQKFLEKYEEKHGGA